MTNYSVYKNRWVNWMVFNGNLRTSFTSSTGTTHPGRACGWLITRQIGGSFIRRWILPSLTRRQSFVLGLPFLQTLRLVYLDTSATEISAAHFAENRRRGGRGSKELQFFESLTGRGILRGQPRRGFAASLVDLESIGQKSSSARPAGNQLGLWWKKNWIRFHRGEARQPWAFNKCNAVPSLHGMWGANLPLIESHHWYYKITTRQRPICL